jgi:hypothetical protein
VPRNLLIRVAVTIRIDN